MSAIAIKSLAILRTVTGVALLALPGPTARLFMLPSASSTLLLRLAGSRDLVLGGLLWSASQSATPSSSSSDDTQPAVLRHALIANAVVDAIDLFAVGAFFAEGSMGLEPTLLVGGGAIVQLGFSLAGLRSWRFRQGGYTQIP